MNPGEAKKKLEAFLSCRKQDSQEYYEACAKGYQALVEEKKLIHLSSCIRQAGLKDDGRPCLAIARADRKQVEFFWQARNPIMHFSCATSLWTATTYPRLHRFVDFADIHNDMDPIGYAKDRRGYALVPHVPADVRPKTGLLSHWYVLWEVEKWSVNSLLTTAPHDPILLNHIHGEIYSILAEWDLTELEKAILEGA